MQIVSEKGVGNPRRVYPRTMLMAIFGAGASCDSSSEFPLSRNLPAPRLPYLGAPLLNFSIFLQFLLQGHFCTKTKGCSGASNPL